MEQIFQQAPFDEKLDEAKMLEVMNEVNQKINKNPLSTRGSCDKCGKYRIGIYSVADMTFTCEVCIAKDEINRRYK